VSGYYGAFLDSLIIALLVATIVYASILNRRLTRFRDNRVELERATRAFAEAALRADAGIKSLRAAADETSRALDEKLVRAQQLRDDLSYLLDSAGRVGIDRSEVKRAAAAGAAAVGAAEPTGEGIGRPAASTRAEPAGARRKTPPDRDFLKAIDDMR
jgi:hypothetical protein